MRRNGVVEVFRHSLSQRQLCAPVWRVGTLQSLQRTLVSHVICQEASRHDVYPVSIHAPVGTSDWVLGAVCCRMVLVQQSALYLLSAVLTRHLTADITFQSNFSFLVPRGGRLYPNKAMRQNTIVTLQIVY